MINDLARAKLRTLKRGQSLPLNGGGRGKQRRMLGRKAPGPACQVGAGMEAEMTKVLWLLTLGAFLLALSSIGAYLWARAFEIVVGVWW